MARENQKWDLQKCVGDLGVHVALIVDYIF